MPSALITDLDAFYDKLKFFRYYFYSDKTTTTNNDETAGQSYGQTSIWNGRTRKRKNVRKCCMGKQLFGTERMSKRNNLYNRGDGFRESIIRLGVKIDNLWAKKTKSRFEKEPKRQKLRSNLHVRYRSQRREAR